MIQGRVFTSFLKQLLKTKPIPHYYTTKSIIQSSVGMIFKYQSPQKFYSVESLIQKWQQIKQVQILMVQRAGYEKDMNAYNVVFPGGQADPGQTDIQACKRELKEEINLSVDEECLYAGRMPSNFYYASKRGRYVYISVNVWVLKEGSKFQPKLNDEELIDYRWVPLEELMNPDRLKSYDARQFGVFKRLGWKFLRTSIQNNLVGVAFPCIDVGMKRELWGLTLWLVSYMFQMSAQNVKGSIRADNVKNDQQLISWLEGIKQKVKQIDVTFKRVYVLGMPLTLVTKLWHQKNRVQQFTYKKSLWLKYQTPFLFLILALLIIILFIVYLR